MSRLADELISQWWLKISNAGGYPDPCYPIKSFLPLPATAFIGSSAHRLIGSSAHRLIGSSAHRLIG